MAWRLSSKAGRPSWSEHRCLTTIEGLDMLELRQDKVTRNEVYFDRSALLKSYGDPSFLGASPSGPISPFGPTPPSGKQSCAVPQMQSTAGTPAAQVSLRDQ
jgi:hypothetical protein